MTLAKTLIDEAVKVCGTQEALAKRMGVYPTDISKLRAGLRPLSPEIAAEIADIAGEDARQAAIDAIIERNKGTRKEGAMRTILGKGLALGAVVLLAFSYSADSNFVTERQIQTKTEFAFVYIVSNSLRQVARSFAQKLVILFSTYKVSFAVRRTLQA